MVLFGHACLASRREGFRHDSWSRSIFWFSHQTKTFSENKDWDQTKIKVQWELFYFPEVRKQKESETKLLFHLEMYNELPQKLIARARMAFGMAGERSALWATLCAHHTYEQARVPLLDANHGLRSSWATGNTSENPPSEEMPTPPITGMFSDHLSVAWKGWKGTSLTLYVTYFSLQSSWAEISHWILSQFWVKQNLR